MPYSSSPSQENARKAPPSTWKSFNFLAPHSTRRHPHNRHPSDLSVAYSCTSDANLPPRSDVDFVISLDPGSSLSTTHQQHADVDIVHDVDLGQAPVENLHFITSTPTGAGSASNQTSRTSTIIGDEVETQDYPLEQPTFDNLQTGAESQDDGDEIDWENDGDDNEEQPQLAPHTTNSPTGKRTRTNEPESLDEEAGML